MIIWRSRSFQRGDHGDQGVCGLHYEALSGTARRLRLGMEYMEETRALLKYELPLNEIIYDFFDALKSRSRGYASFDYEMKGYEQFRTGEAGYPH